MTSNVFGQPVTDGNRSERALKAFMDPNAGGKRDQALQYVRKKKEEFGNGVSTLCMFYNATGETIFYVDEHDWYGHIYDSYPVRAENGQWGAFLHTKKALVPSGSVGAVVYRGKYSNTQYCEQLLAWDTPWSPTQSNHCYCEINDDGTSYDWDAIYAKMENCGKQHCASGKGIFTFTTIEGGTSPLFEAKLTLGDIPAAKAEAKAAAAKAN